MLAGFKASVAAAVDLILPPRCPGTGEIVDRPGMVSPAFWSRLSFIEEPHCATCGLPFGFETAAGALCAACLEMEPHFDRARSALVYNDASRELVLSFKYGDRLHAVHTFLPWLMRAGAGMVADCDVIVPVPLHARRLWLRRFNQSALLAAALSRASGKPWLHDALLRTRHTPKQKGLSRQSRAANVRGAFAVSPKHDLKDRRVLLIDDVFTSGATLNECARSLKKNGVSEVYILTIARVTRDEIPGS